MDKIAEKVAQILDQKISENSLIDYKLRLNEDYLDCDLIIDIVAFLNCIEEDYKKDKFIIVGIKNNSLNIEGIDLETWPDDSIIQSKIKSYISSSPNVKTGHFKYHNKNIGYIYIEQNNPYIPYTTLKELKKKSKTFSSNSGWRRINTSNIFLKNEDFDDFYSWMFKHRSVEPNIFNEIKNKNVSIINEVAIHRMKSNYEKIEVYPQINNGIFTIFHKLTKWVIKFESISNNSARVYSWKYSNYSNIRNVGISSSSDELDKDRFDFNKNEFNFTSDIVEPKVGGNYIACLINEEGKVLLVKTIKAESSSHGYLNDKLYMEFRCL